MKVKICGLRRPQDVAAANAAKPDYIGFIFAEKSKRYVTPETALALKHQLASNIQAVGVFVDASVETIADIVKSGAIDMVQLHGHEDTAFLEELRKEVSCPIIKAHVIHTPEDAKNAEAFPADHVLLDSGSGSGQTFDWSVLQKVQRPYFLAGGLSPENVTAAIRQLHPYGVDVSSGVETDGYKDAEKMARFVKACREEETHEQ